jgi:hypothetical protein
MVRSFQSGHKHYPSRRTLRNGPVVPEMLLADLACAELEQSSV